MKCDEPEVGRFFAVVTRTAAIVMLSCSGLSVAPDAGCDGCISSGTCVSLAQTSREQCGRDGQTCQTSCPVCDQGRCSTGWECPGYRRPAICECGFECIEGVGSRACGDCNAGSQCVANRCAPDDAGTDAGALDGGTRDGG